jgi:hypothetical protein
VAETFSFGDGIKFLGDYVAVPDFLFSDFLLHVLLFFVCFGCCSLIWALFFRLSLYIS